MNTIITLTETEFIKNPSTKTTYIQVSNETKEINEKEYFLTVNDNTIKYFRRLGGRETVTKGYTCAGYKVVKVVSTSPDRQTKVVREYKFKSVSLPVNYGFENLSLYGKFHNLQSRGLMTDELKEKFATYKANNETFDYLNNEFNSLNK